MHMMSSVARLLGVPWPVLLAAGVLLAVAAVLLVWDWCERAPETAEGPNGMYPPVDYQQLGDVSA